MRSNSGMPIASSNWRICIDTAGCVRCNSSAARAKLGKRLAITKICNRLSGLCLDVAGSATTEGAGFDQIAYVSQPRDKFRILKNGPFNYSFQAQSTGKLVSLASSTLWETVLPPVKQFTAASTAAEAMIQPCTQRG